MSTTIFNGSNTYAGFYEAFKGGDASVTIARGKGGNANIGNGFLVQQYTIQAARGVNTLRFVNTTDLAAQIGALQGNCQLVGLIGTKGDFTKLLTGGTAGNGDGSDVCSPITVTIKGAGGFQKCDASGKVVAAGDSVTFRASGGIVTGVNITGQIDQNGVLMQQGTVTFTFTKLEIE